jgi:hypothetical protein
MAISQQNAGPLSPAALLPECFAAALHGRGVFDRTEHVLKARQARVALRRLRCALGMFADALPSAARACSTFLCSVKGDSHRCFNFVALPSPVSWTKTSFTSAQISSFAVIRPKSV